MRGSWQVIATSAVTIIMKQQERLLAMQSDTLVSAHATMCGHTDMRKHKQTMHLTLSPYTTSAPAAQPTHLCKHCVCLHTLLQWQPMANDCGEGPCFALYKRQQLLHVVPGRTAPRPAGHASSTECEASSGCPSEPGMPLPLVVSLIIVP